MYFILIEEEIDQLHKDDGVHQQRRRVLHDNAQIRYAAYQTPPLRRQNLKQIVNLESDVLYVSLCASYTPPRTLNCQ